MQKNPVLTSQAFLSRLALTIDDKTPIDPYRVITDFFCFGSLEEMKAMFGEVCTAALAEQYQWKQGSPGNLLYFYERLEKLVEACFLIVNGGKHKNKRVKKIKRGKSIRAEDIPRLPCMLSVAEINDPFSVLQSFFEFHSIKRWKQDLYTWMEAGLSDFTVLENRAPKTLFSYHQHLQKLLDACWYISLRIKNKKD